MGFNFCMYVLYCWYVCAFYSFITVFQLACLDKSLPQSVGFAKCSDFYVTFVLFEYCHSSVTSALQCLQRLLNVVPSSSILSLLYVQLVSTSESEENAWEVSTTISHFMIHLSIPSKAPQSIIRILSKGSSFVLPCC